MKEVKKEIPRVEYQTVYVAEDGEEFLTPAECEKYENAAAHKLMAKLKDITINENAMTDWFDEGDDNQYHTVVPKTMEDIDNLNHLWFMFGGKCNGSNPKFIKEDIECPIVIGFRIEGCSYDWMWFYKIVDCLNEMTNGKFTVKLKEEK